MRSHEWIAHNPFKHYIFLPICHKYNITQTMEYVGEGFTL